MDVSSRDLRYYDIRKETRHKMDCDCYLVINGKIYLGTINDISFGGISFILYNYDDALEIGKHIIFSLYRTNYPAIDMLADVRNISTVEKGIRIGMQVLSGDTDMWNLIVHNVKNEL